MAPKAVEPIAICGVGMRLPAGVKDSNSFWDFLYNKRSGRCKVPADRYNIENWYGKDKIGHVISKYGYFLSDVDLTKADASFWSMTKDELKTADPSQRLTLEVAYECLQTAGESPEHLKGHKVGVFAGSFDGDWLEMDGRDPQHSHLYRLTGYGDYMLSNRLHYEFGFTGPSVTTRTACSSSLTSLHQACQAIQMGECESALVATANLIISPRTSATMQEEGVLSPSGCCKSFDADADGYARGEAVSALYIKKLSDAIRDGSPIRSIIRSTAVNSDGHGPTLVSPSAAAHEELMRKCHQLAGLSDFSRTAMIECHGTGTVVGDPIEANAVANIFGSGDGIYIGSVKSNLGHSESASGLSSIIKMMLALENSTIPPNINFETPNPKIPFERCKLTVPTEPMPWPKDKDELVGVNSFGIGGSNAHVLLSSATSFALPKAKKGENNAVTTDNTTTSRLLIFSATHPDSLLQTLEDHEHYLMSYPASLQDMSFSLALKRQVFSRRAFCVVSDERQPWAPTICRQSVNNNTKPPKLVFTFTGQGAQWPQMGQTLIQNSKVFRDTIERLDAFLQTLPHPPSWTLLEELQKPPGKDRLVEAEISQPCCIAVQVALVCLLAHYGIKPDAAVGHSAGEVAASFACGAITAEEAILIAYYRGVVLASIDEFGGMAAVGFGPHDVNPFLKDGVSIGCENSPQSTTLTGSKEGLEKVMADIKEKHPEAFVRMLRVEMAYHSQYMDVISKPYLALLQGNINSQKPLIPYLSSVLGKQITGAGELGPEYWVNHVLSPVRFSTAVATILQEMPEKKLFFEIGPHSALAGPMRQCLQGHYGQSTVTDEYLSTMIRKEDCHANVLKSVGNLWLQGFEINFKNVVGSGDFLVDLPLYPWHHDESFWNESRLSQQYRMRQFPHHDILGSRVLESTDHNPIWRNILRLDSVPWIKEHEIMGSTVFPGAGYICMIGEAIRQQTAISSYTARNVQIMAPMILQNGKNQEIVTQLEQIAASKTTDSKWYKFTISSYQSATNSWIKHSSGEVCAEETITTTPSTNNGIESFPRVNSRKSWYRKLRNMGLEYGPRFTCLTNMTSHLTEPKMTATILLDDDARTETQQEGSSYAVHPTTLDSMMQAIVIASCNGLTRRLKQLAVPTFIKEIHIQPIDRKLPLSVLASGKDERTDGYTGDVVGTQENGIASSISFIGLQLSMISEKDDSIDTGLDRHAAVETVWKDDISFMTASSSADVIDSATSEIKGFLDLLSHHKPNLQILEIGTASSDPIASLILPMLRSDYNERMYGTYTYAGISETILETGRQQLEGWNNLEFTILDIYSDPQQQEAFESVQFDLAISRISHSHDPVAIRKALSNLKALMNANGFLYLQIEDQNTENWLTDANSWHQYLNGVQLEELHRIKENGIQHCIIKLMPNTSKSQKRITLLSSLASLQNEACMTVKAAIYKILQDQNYQIEECMLEDAEAEPLLAEQDILSLLDLEGPFFRTMDAKRFSLFQKMLSQVQDLKIGLLWLSRSCQINSTEPDYGMLPGVSRAIRTELEIDFATVEAATWETRDLSCVVNVLDKFQHRVPGGRIRSSDEWIVSNGRILIGRCHYIIISKELSQTLKVQSTTRKLSQYGPGLTDTFYWKEQNLNGSNPDEVTVEIKAVGLNFKDVMIALGVITAKVAIEEGLGYEASGIITAVGSNVDPKRIGERVMISGSGLFSSRCNVSSSLCVKLADEMSFEDGASMPVVYMTVIYGLLNVASLEEGMSVLIHSAAGGVGLAAIQIAQMVGAKIFCTVGSNEKAQYLHDHCGIPLSHIFHSRDASFLPSLMAITNGDGVDVVLNSLAGELMEVSMKCVADCGSFVDLGFHDIGSGSKLLLEFFSGNRRYYGVDLLHIIKKSPSIIHRLMNRTMELFKEGHIRPIARQEAFTASNITAPFRHMQTSTHIGKIVISMPDEVDQLLPSEGCSKQLQLSPEKAYLFVGGLGGLGRAISTWLVEHGAKHVVFLSRSADRVNSDDPLINELTAAGCQTTMVCGDVSCYEDVCRAIDGVDIDFAGVIHAAMVLKEENILNLSFDDWTSATKVKTDGTWNLHNAFLSKQDEPLEAFLLFSSTGSMAGHPGLSNYSAANTMMESFVDYRHSLGLAASVLNVGTMEDAGYVQENQGLMDSLRTMGQYFSREEELLDCLELMFLRSKPLPHPNIRRSQIGMGVRSCLPLSSDKNRVPWRRERRFLMAYNMENSALDQSVTKDTSSNNSQELGRQLKQFSGNMEMLKTAEAADILARAIGKTLLGFTTRSERQDNNNHDKEAKLDLELPLADLGMDSLISIELRNWVRRVIGVDLAVLDIAGAENLGRLGQLTQDKLVERFEARI